MQKDLWIVSEYSDWRYDESGMKSEVFAFDNFEEAKKAFRNRICEYAKKEREIYNEQNKDKPSFDEEEFAKEIAELKPEEIMTNSRVVNAVGGFYDMLFELKSNPEFPASLQDIKKYLDYENYLLNKGKYYRGLLTSMYFFEKKEQEGSLWAHYHIYEDSDARGTLIDLNCLAMDNPDAKYFFHEAEAGIGSNYLVDLQKVTI